MEEERFRWCIERERWTTEWRHGAYTDEVTIQNYSNLKDRAYVDKSLEESSIVYNPRAGIFGRFKVNIYAYIAYDKSAIYRVPDERFNARTFMIILNEHGAVDSMAAQSEHQVTFIQQDNLRTHYVNEATQFIDSKGLEIMPIPRYSPELAPIENIFAIFKRKVHDHLKDSQVRSKDELWEVCKSCWRSIPLQSIRNVIDSMPKRCETVIKSCGKTIDC